MTSRTKLLAATTLLVLAVFVGDIVVPLGIAGGVLYVVVILLAMWLPRRFVYWYAVVCTMLTVIGFFASPEGSSLLTDLANRAVAMFAVWVVAVLGLQLKKLGESLHQRGLIIDQVQEGIIVVDMEGIVGYWNKGAESIFGYTEAEIVGESIARLFESGEPEAVEEYALSLLLTQGSGELETRGKSQVGEDLILRQWLLLRRDEQGNPIGVILHVADITRRREEEEDAARIEIFYQGVLNELPLQIAIFDPEGRFLYLNPASLSDEETRRWILGRTEREYFASVGRNIGAGQDREKYRQQAITERTAINYEEEFLTASGEHRSYLNGFSPIVNESGQVTKVLGYRYDITDHKETAQHLRALSQRLVQVQEDERHSIARELHDEIGQALTGLKLLLETIDVKSLKQQKEPLEEARSIVLRLLGRVRDISLDLRPAMLDDLGLLAALLWLTDRYSKRTGIEIDFRHAGLEGRFDPDLETASYRIVQEALTNVARHSGAKRVDVRVLSTSETLLVSVEDKGSGFDMKDPATTRFKSGLSGMQERVSLLDGKLSIETDSGQGTSLTAEFPLVERVVQEEF